MTSEITVSKTLMAVTAKIENGGRTVEQTSAFEDVVEELLVSSKARINKESSPHYSDISDETATYVVVRDQAGRLEGFVSIRLLLLGKEGLKGHLRRQYRRIYGEGVDAIDPEQLPDVVHRVTGRVGFISDVFIERTARGVGRLDPTLMIILAYAIARLRWRPDWIFGFTKNRDVRRGLAGRYLATRLYPSAIKWLVETPNRRDDDWLLCLNSDDINYALEAAPALIGSVQCGRCGMGEKQIVADSRSHRKDQPVIEQVTAA